MRVDSYGNTPTPTIDPLPTPTGTGSDRLPVPEGGVRDQVPLDHRGWESERTIGPSSSRLWWAREWGTALSPSALPVVSRADSPATRVTLQEMMWLTTGGECIDTVYISSVDYN